MNLIDLYNSVEPLSSYKKVDVPPPEYCPEDWAFDIERKPNERGLPCYLVFMREHFEKNYPRASVRIFEDSIQQERKEPKFMASIVHESLRYGHFQVYNQLVIDQVGQSVLIKGTFMLNHQFIKISNRQQIYMALRKAAKLNLELSPLRIAISPLEGSIELIHCSYVDCKFGMLNNSYKNIVYFTERMGFIIDKINSEIDTLFYFLEDDSLFRFYSGKLQKHIQEGGEMLATMENSLYLTHFSISNMDYVGKVGVIGKYHESFSEDISRIMKVFGVDAQKVEYCKPNQIQSFSSEKYPQETVRELATQIDQHIKFRVHSKIQFYDDNLIWRELEEYSGNCKIEYAHARFFFLDDLNQRSTPNKKQNIPKNDDDTDIFYIKETSLQSFVEAKLTRKSFQRNKAKIQREKGVVRNLKGKSHPNVMTFLESDSPRDKQFIYTLFEENQSLDRFVIKCMTLSFYQKLFMLEQAAKGLLFIHRSNILHLDYKPANLIVGKKYLVKVCDFGQSCTVSQKKGHKFGTTFPFAPPQVYSMRKEEISEKVDIYALGVTMYLCLFSRHIWGAIRSQTEFILSLKQGARFPILLPQHYSDLPCSKMIRILVQLCLKCINSSPQCRPTLVWIVTYLQRMRVCLQHLHYK